MGLVKGFTDIIAPQNLATNGAWRINQRGLFLDLAPLKVGDFVSDAWACLVCTMDSVQVKNETARGTLRFKGHGKKGQILSLRSWDTSNGVNSYGWADYTAKVIAVCEPTSVPMMVEVAPRLNLAVARNNYIKTAVLKPGTSGYAVNSSGFSGSVSQGAIINFYLMADGPFDILLLNFIEILGTYVNPPDTASVNYADDLLRCKRYYQSGLTRNNHRFSTYAANVAINANYERFPVEMAGTPTLSFNITEVRGMTGTGGYTADTADTCLVVNTDPQSIGFRAYVMATNSPYHAELTTNGSATLVYWTATV